MPKDTFPSNACADAELGPSSVVTNAVVTNDENVLSKRPDTLLRSTRPEGL